jgi:hypothetical protein
MALYKKNKTTTADEMPVGTFRNGFFYPLTGASTTLFVLGSAGSADNTRFSIFCVPTDGEFSVEYQLLGYTSGTIQEAIFKYDPLGQLGKQIVNQNWATPSVGFRRITNCSMEAGLYWICLRSDSSVTSTVSGTSTTSTGPIMSIDLAYFANIYKLNGAIDSPSWLMHQFALWDNSSNPAVQATYNGTLSDFSPYTNCVNQNKYLYPIYDSGNIRTRIIRTA